MKKIILSNIIKSAVIVLLATAVMVLLLQAVQSVNRQDNTSRIRTEDAIEKLEQSETSIQELTESLNNEYLSKARSFAEMIALNPDILTSKDELAKIMKMLDVDELHITDENGIIQWGTVEGYYGYDMASAEQSGQFMPAISDPDFELAQEAQPNGAEGTLFQYVGVARRDKPGIVQIGMEPIRLTKALSSNSPQALLEDVYVGTEGRMFVINKEDMTIAAFMDADKVGLPAQEAGFTEKNLSALDKGTTFRYNNTAYRCLLQENDRYYVGTIVPVSEVNGQVIVLTLSISIVIALGFAVLAFVVKRSVDRNVVSGVTEITGLVSRIENGEYTLRINVDSCDEFRTLSNGINKMLDTLSVKFEEDERNNARLRSMFSDISSVSDGINRYSDQMKDISREISDGSASQAAAIEELAHSFTEISNRVISNAEEARNASEAFMHTRKGLDRSSEKMSRMQLSMKEINAASQKINNIVKTIDDIAFQTNILALNASVEAARAGAQGKGFAVVADEVRNLANKSAEAASMTTTLINQAISAISDGIDIADSATEELNSMLTEVDNNAVLISDISRVTKQQADSIQNAVTEMKEISGIVRNNSSISATAEGTSEKLYSEARKLIRIINTN